MNASRIRENAAFWTLTAISAVFGLQMLRLLYSTLMYYLRDSQGMSAINLAPIGLGVFALSFLAAPLWKFTGTRAALTIAVGGLAKLDGTVFHDARTSVRIDQQGGGVGVVQVIADRDLDAGLLYGILWEL